MKGIDPELAAWGMANDPEFAMYAKSQMAQQQSAVQGQQLAKAHAGVEDFLKQRELQRQETFRNTPSDVPIPMRAPEYKAPSGIEQWRERNNAMIASGNPFLQERAANQMDKGFSPREKLQTIIGGTPEGGRQNLILNPDGTTTPVGPAWKSASPYESSINKALTASDYLKYKIQDPQTGKWRTPQPSDAQTVGELNRLNPRVVDKVGYADQAKITGLEGGLEAVAKAAESLYLEDGSLDSEMLNYVSLIDTMPDSIKNTGVWLGRQLPMVNEESLDKANAFMNSWDRAISPVLRTETGAEAPPHERADIRNRFMPNKADTKELAREKQRAYIAFVSTLIAHAKDGTTLTIAEAQREADRLLPKAAPKTSSVLTELPAGATEYKPGGM